MRSFAILRAATLEYTNAPTRQFLYVFEDIAGAWPDPSTFPRQAALAAVAVRSTIRAVDPLLLLICLSAGGGLLLLALWGRVNEQRWRDWDMLLNIPEDELLARTHLHLDGEQWADDVGNLVPAQPMRSVDEAIRLLDLGYRMIERVAPDLRSLVFAAAVFSRMVVALAPVAPLWPRDFKAPRPTSLAALNQILHRFLVATADRVRLRLHIWGGSLGLVARFVLGKMRQTVERQPDSDRERDQIRGLRDDLRTLLEDFRCALVQWPDLRPKRNRRLELTVVRLWAASLLLIFLAWHLAQIGTGS
jgi:hypothetical protein